MSYLRPDTVGNLSQPTSRARPASPLEINYDSIARKIRALLSGQVNPRGFFFFFA